MTRIPTTHIGSLPRPDDLAVLLRQRDAGGVTEGAAFEARVRSAVEDVVRRQVAAGLDIVNDGEQSKPDYSTYIKDRLTGFEGEPTSMPVGADLRTFPPTPRGRAPRLRSGGRRARVPSPGATSRAVERDIRNLAGAVPRPASRRRS